MGTWRSLGGRQEVRVQGTGRLRARGATTKTLSRCGEGIGKSLVVREKRGEGGGDRQRQAPRSLTGVHKRRLLLLLLGYSTPVNASRNSRSSRGEPSPTPLHPHPNQLLPAAHVGGETFILRDARQETRGSMTSAGSQSEDS